MKPPETGKRRVPESGIGFQDVYDLSGQGSVYQEEKKKVSSKVRFIFTSKNFRPSN